MHLGIRRGETNATNSLPDMNTQIYQIYFSDKTKSSLDSGFIPLDNTRNERPDWREYWPIRQFFSEHKVNEGELYGFLSHAFHLKTGLRSADVQAFLTSRPADYDVFIFSPFFDVSATFWNVFEQGNSAHPGLISTAKQLFSDIDLNIDLDRLVTHSANTVFSNFFIARPAFWFTWLDIAGKLFSVAEQGSSDLRTRLTSATSYLAHKQDVQMKVFIMERLASLLLATSKQFRIAVYPPYKLPLINKPLQNHIPDLLIADSLKIAYSATQDVTYRETYRAFMTQFQKHTGYRFSV